MIISYNNKQFVRDHQTGTLCKILE